MQKRCIDFEKNKKKFQSLPKSQVGSSYYLRPKDFFYSKIMTNLALCFIIKIMALEIERKFLVVGEFKSLVTKSYRIVQAYLCSGWERTVRVRIKGDKGFITIKGRDGNSGISRYEWEKEIPVEEAEELLKICKPGMIDKTRYLVPAGKHTFEVDEFYGDNEGLVIAEIELTSENETFEKPAFLGQEVTQDEKYYNSMLIKNPYKKWEVV